VDRETVIAHHRRRQRQEAMHLVAAEHVEPDHAQAFAVEQQVDRTTELDPVQA
jgi:hypothetical protein